MKLLTPATLKLLSLSEVFRLRCTYSVQQFEKPTEWDRLTENGGHEFARQCQISYENRLHYIRVCISFKSFVCKASVLTYKKLNCSCSP